ncbi:MAG: type III-B CRISPR module RAMP protein Cmr4 [Bryobacteraceae bacterium]|nr:type III-B CRISPR module RAMP protein Cmr4 [Bryobacteraceae bacterium]
MNTVLLGMLAETAIHPGAGRSGGVIDLPVAREAATNYPYIPGSSLKGALRDKAERGMKNGNPDKWFGKADAAGDLLVSDARLLLLPVRSLTGSYRWLTCPHIIERLQRDMRRAGIASEAGIPKPDKGTVHTAGTGKIYLEERQFTINQDLEEGLVADLSKLIEHESTRSRLKATIAIVHDDDFAWFAGYALPVQARNVLDDNTKQSKNLWYEETLPPDTLMYALVASRSDSASTAVRSLFDDSYLQTGGNETTGEGWFIIAVRESTPEASVVRHAE